MANLFSLSPVVPQILWFPTFFLFLFLLISFPNLRDGKKCQTSTDTMELRLIDSRTKQCVGRGYSHHPVSSNLCTAFFPEHGNSTFNIPIAGFRTKERILMIKPSK